MKTLPSRQIPAIANLIVFQLCAQHLSFTKVGQKVGLSQGAVSRQVIELEEFLHQNLFFREQRSLRLTQAGERYLAKIEPLLLGLEEASNELRMEHVRAGLLHVSIAISLCYRWLVSRLPDFSRLHPDVMIKLNPEYSYDINQKATTNDSDVSILFYAKTPLLDANAQLLFPLRSCAICVPSLLNGKSTLTMQELLELPLLHQKEVPNYWQHFIDDAGFPELIAPAGMENLTIIMTIQSTLAGLGVALIPPYLVEKELASGQLVRAHSHHVMPDYGHYMTYNETRRNWPPLVKFRDWVSQQAAETLQSET